jgi:hypothetical protein
VALTVLGAEPPLLTTDLLAVGIAGFIVLVTDVSGAAVVYAGASRKAVESVPQITAD